MLEGARGNVRERFKELIHLFFIEPSKCVWAGVCGVKTKVCLCARGICGRGLGAGEQAITPPLLLDINLAQIYDGKRFLSRKKQRQGERKDG